MTVNSKDHLPIETKTSDMPGYGVLDDDQTDLMEGISTRLHGLGYPAVKNDILQQAIKNGADPSVINSIKKVPARHYASPAEILEEIRKRR